MVGGFAIGPSVLFRARPVFCRGERSGRRPKGERAWSSHRHQRSIGLEWSLRIDRSPRCSRSIERIRRRYGQGRAQADADAVPDHTAATNPEPDSHAHAKTDPNAHSDIQTITHAEADTNATADPDPETVINANPAAKRHATTTAPGRACQPISRPTSDCSHGHRIG
jgi:hypothetical protein